MTKDEDPIVNMGEVFLDEDNYLIDYEVYSCHLDFKIHKVVGRYEDAVELFHIDYPQKTYDRREARIYSSGYIKWDGCINIKFNDEGYLHFCYLEQTKIFGIIFDKLYELAQKEIPNAMDNLAN